MMSLLDREEMNRHWFSPALLLILVVILGFALRLYFYLPQCDNDCYEYLTAARIAATDWNNFLKSNEVWEIYYHSRLALVLPTAFFIKIFGLNRYSASMWGIICSILSIVVIYLLANSIFKDKRIALLSSSILALMPFHSVLSSQLLPDSIQQFFVASAVLCLILAGKKQKRVLRVGFYTFAGLFFALAGHCRITGYVFAVILLFGFFIFFEKLKREHIFIIFGFLFIEFIFHLVYIFQAGDLLLRFHALLQLDPRYHMNARPPWYYVRNLFRFSDYFGFFFFLFIPAFFYLLLKLRKLKHLAILITWIFPVYLILEFAITPDKEDGFIFIVKHINYSLVFVIPAVLIVSYFFVDWARTLVLKSISVCLVAVLVLSFFYNTSQLHNTYREREMKYIKVANFLDTLQPKKVFALFPHWSHRVNFYQNESVDRSRKSKGNLHRIIAVRGEDFPDCLRDMEDSYVIKDVRRLTTFSYQYGLRQRTMLNADKEFYQFWANIPKEAILLYGDDDVYLYYFPKGISISSKKDPKDLHVLSNTKIDDHLVFVGFDFFWGSVNPKKVLNFILYFKCLADLKEDYRFYFHTQGNYNGRVVEKVFMFQNDEIYRTSFWEPNEVNSYREQINLENLDKGVYKLRLIVKNNKVQIDLGEVEISDNSCKFEF